MLIVDDDIRSAFALTSVLEHACDSIAKPVDIDQLLSMMRAWLVPR